MDFLYAFSIALRYEFHMQIQRLALWATFLGFAALVFAVAWQGNWTHWSGEKIPLDSFASWTVIVNLFIPPATGILLADRLYRDRKLSVDELFSTAQGSVGCKLLGKYIGCLLATLMPMLIIYCIGIGFDFYHWQALIGWKSTLQALPLALGAFSYCYPAGSVVHCRFFFGLPCGALVTALPVSLCWILVLGQHFQSS